MRPLRGLIESMLVNKCVEAANKPNQNFFENYPTKKKTRPQWRSQRKFLTYVRSVLPHLIFGGTGITSYRTRQNSPQTLRGLRETAIVKPIGEEI